jgi:hypothetical protein
MIPISASRHVTHYCPVAFHYVGPCDSEMFLSFLYVVCDAMDSEG